MKQTNRDLSDIPLAKILLNRRVISAEHLEKAISALRSKGGRLSELLVRRGIVKEEDVASALAELCSVPLVSGTVRPLEGQELDKLIPKSFAQRNAVIPIAREGNTLSCAMFDPLDFMLLEELRKITGCEVTPVVATKSGILKAVEEFYGLKGPSAQNTSSYKTAEILGQTINARDDSLSLDKMMARAGEAPVVRMVDLIIWQAIDKRASDIHIEPFKDRICLRYRIDGKLYELEPPPNHMYLPIVSRIKIMAKLDIAERRLPQDGTFVLNLEDRTIDFRISVIPTIYGEKVVLRILDRSGIVLDLDKMGFEGTDLISLRKAIRSPYGLVLITGPTGSGKSTTLYAILQEIKSTTLNIVTVEDPVEYRLDGINQVQVKPEIGLTFASSLRSFLRQDPDIMLVGEVRDLETAEICVRSALTGHLVLSTLHTNDAPSALTRLMDIGVEPYLLAPSLILVIGQRLVRKLCPECKEAYKPTKTELGDIELRTELAYRPVGCTACGNTGYKGRTLIAEILPVSEEVKSLVSRAGSYKELRDRARAAGMITLYEAGISKVELGITSLQEVVSATLGI